MNEIENQKQEILSLDDIYFKDAFTKTEDKLNLEVNNANIDCMTSRNNKFSLDSDGNLIINSLTANSINIQNIFDSIYPVGSIYLAMNNTNPSTLFGGVWEPIKGKFLLGCNDDYLAGSEGGETQHTLTVNEIPKHNHAIPNSNAAGYNSASPNMGSKGWIATPPAAYTSNVGGNQPHNNMPPYLAIYIWQRIA